MFEKLWDENSKYSHSITGDNGELNLSKDISYAGSSEYVSFLLARGLEASHDEALSLEQLKW